MPHLIVNGTKTPNWEHVRRAVSPFFDFPPGTEDPGDYPHYGRDMYSNNITCGRNASLYAATTKTATVLAGSEVGFAINDRDPDAWQGFIHGGPHQIYLSKVPDGTEIENFVGNEEEACWFKIASFAQNKTTNREWLMLGASEVKFNIPKTTPPGRYLLRYEGMNPYAYYEQTQWFVNCAHVDIVGPGGGSPPAALKFPGTYKLEDPSIFVSFAVDRWILDSYVPPGPAPWTG
ncbi:glycoside hydrolase [Massariosphaeria phaeospora]|uniref:lytic cellulose monooxygenase (C4-dehydrogenating) n=1 Tax=Massariosphaeria phaeospora TaxID=100035 RepID=A0A7C8IJI3_9PLEO|nr:glycoside hydrolase [Massariosphaeria phaeospora]